MNPDKKANQAEAIERAMRMYNEGNWKAAVRLFTRAFVNGKQTPGILNNIALAQKNRDALDMAIATLRLALRREPQNASIWSNLGNALRDAGRLQEAEAAQRQAIGIKPREAQFHYHLGIVLMENNEPEKALSYFEAALRLKAGHEEAAWDHALALLQLGRWKEAWPGYAIRWQLDGLRKRLFPEKTWDGKPFRGTLVVYHEQGLGDLILVARYFAWARKQCSRLVVLCQPTLAGLIATVSGVDEVVPAGHEVPEGLLAQAWCPAMDLLKLSNAAPANISGKPYLSVPVTSAERHLKILPARKTFFRAGIVWSGSTTFVYNHKRSTTLNHLLRLLEVDGVKLFSLQKGEPAEALKEPGMPVLVHDLSPRLGDFADTAAVIKHLDLVITTDTAVAHLCGALGVPVWVLLAWRYDWRWLDAKHNTVWYDSMRLFRQPAPGDWNGLMNDVVKALREMKG